MDKEYHIHLISDSTGGTLGSVVKACLSQFKVTRPTEHMWNLVRNERQLKKAIEGVRAHPGPVLFTMVDTSLAEQLIKTCKDLDMPCIPLLQPVIDAFGNYFDMESRAEPGRQHQLNAEYFARMDAVDYALHHDDGQKTHHTLSDADVILIGVSRTSKTPTCIYLANRGIKAANIPYVPGVALPDNLELLEKPMFVGLTESPNRLVEIRANRLRQLGEVQQTDYLTLEKVEEEVAEARNLYKRMGWPVIDVTRRSIEETAAEILALLNRREEQRAEQEQAKDDKVAS